MQTANEIPEATHASKFNEILPMEDTRSYLNRTSILARVVYWRTPLSESFPSRPMVLYQSNVPLDTQAYLSSRPSVRYLRRLKYDIYVLEIDRGLFLEIEITHDGQRYIAYDKRFGIYGTGDSGLEAMEDFQQSFIEFYLDIVESPKRTLGKSALRFRETLLSFATLTVNG